MKQNRIHKLMDLSRVSEMEALFKGQSKRRRMVELVQNVTKFNQNEKYPHLYIYSPPGLGKTFTVNHSLKESDIVHYVVSGNTSMFAFGIQLAVINYISKNKVNIVIHVDDCDEIFKNEQNCNTMKNVLDGEKKFIYEKSLSSQWSSLGDTQKDAITFYGEEGKMGFSVPTDNFRFIFTSNFSLPVDDDVQAAREKGGNKSILMAHRNAIRSRCNVADFDLTAEEHWGWIADVVMQPNFLTDLNQSSGKKMILAFLKDNWHLLHERSIRSVEKMANTITNYPENFITIWEMDYLKRNQHGN